MRGGRSWGSKSGIALLSLYLFFPLYLLLFFAETPVVRADFWYVLASSSLQALLSAIASVAFGLLGAGGLFYLQERISKRVFKPLQIALLVPGFVPVLFFLLAFLKFFPAWRGLSAVVAVHTFLNIGLTAFLLQRRMRTLLGGVAELAWIEGASRWCYWRRVVLPLLKTDLVWMGFFVFALSFMSFAVPLVLGGTQGRTIEVLIYEKIRIYGGWGEAMSLAFAQILILFMFSFFIRPSAHAMEPYERQTRLLQIPLGAFLVFVPVLLLLSGLFIDLPYLFRQPESLAFVWNELPSWLAGSLLTGIGTGFLALVCLLLIAYCDVRGRVRQLLNGYVAPSTVLTGYAFILFIPTTGDMSFIKIILGLNLIFLCSLYRLQWGTALQSLEAQRDVARALGAGEFSIFKTIVLPQVWPTACLLSGVAAFWAWGDFALSTVVAERPLHLALAARSLMGSYRLEAATFLIWLIVAGGALSFALFWGMGYVADSQSKS